MRVTLTIILFVLVISQIQQSITSHQIVAAINDNGKATDYRLKKIVERIDNYNLDSLKGNN